MSIVAEKRVDLLCEEEIEEGCGEYGYTPSQDQERITLLLSQGCNVFVSKSGSLSYMDTDLNPHRTYERGRIATYFLGIVNRIDPSGPKCQCLVVTLHTAYQCDIDESMNALAQRCNIAVEVEGLQCRRDTDPATCPHVLIGGFLEMKIFLSIETLCFDDVKMVVFDWGDAFMGHKTEIELTTAILQLLNVGARDIQVAVFSQTNMEVEIWSKSSLLAEVPVIQCHESSVRRCTLEGVNKHLFINVEVDKENPEQPSKLNTLYEMIGECELSEQTRTIIVAGDGAKFYFLVKSLSESRLKFVSAKRGMSQKDKDIMLERFLHQDYLLITTKAFHLDMPSDYFDSSVYSIIFYDCPEEYMHYLGWFRDVGKAITLAGPEDMFTLLEAQDTHGVLFERMMPSEFLGDNHHETEPMSVFGNDYSFKQYADMVFTGDCMRKPAVEHMIRIFLAVAPGCISVIFEESAEAVKEMVTRMKNAVSAYKRAPFVTSRISEAEEKVNGNSSCVLVICDDAIRGESDISLLQIKQFVRVVISSDIPRNEDDCIRRLGLCWNDGVIIHFGTCLNWFKLFDIQTKISNPLRHFREYVIVDDLMRFNLLDRDAIFRKRKSTADKFKGVWDRMSTLFIKGK